MSGMRPCDQQMLDRLAEYNPLGWRPECRDEEGNAIFRFDTRLPSGMVRIARMKVTPKGLLYDNVEVEGANG